MKTIKGEIALLTKEFDNATCTYYWNVQVWCDDEPALRLGKCKVIQE